ncbi:MAG: HD-GYP domain-containing protein, partial [bacterium]|nr:HD-GYP domain-containing protein [bacterium]
TLVNSLRRSNIEITLAYDTTLEGWSKALDMRDSETEGHTLRVAQTTVALARMLNFPDSDLPHLRRGALLHDIGKIGIPDNILLKPDKLTDDEWTIMRKHPALGYEMLLPIEYLRPCIAIPYSHHEKWDGTGYPQGLKGEQIPVMARIFSIVDVWDAITSDRPYRKAWPENKALEYIEMNSGIYFDPQFVSVFLRMIRKRQQDK